MTKRERERLRRENVFGASMAQSEMLESCACGMVKFNRPLNIAQCAQCGKATPLPGACDDVALHFCSNTCAGAYFRTESLL